MNACNTALNTAWCKCVHGHCMPTHPYTNNKQTTYMSNGVDNSHMAQHFHCQ